MAWDEWEHLKAEAAQRRSTRMQLNQHLADQGGGGGESAWGDLTVNRQDLAAVGTAAHELFDKFGEYGEHARAASTQAAGGLKSEGFALGGALEHVAQRWSDQTRSLLDACAHISNHLRVTKNQHEADDTYIAGAISSISQLDRGFDEQKGK